MTIDKKRHENLPISENIDPMVYKLADKVIIKYGGDLSDRYNNPYRLSLNMANNLVNKNLSTSEMKEVANLTRKLKQSMHKHDEYYLTFLSPENAQNILHGILKTGGYKNLNLDQAIDKLYSGRTQSDVEIIKKAVEKSLNTGNLSDYKLADVLKDENWRPLFFKGLQNGNGYSNKSQVETITHEEFEKRIGDPNYKFKPPKPQKKQKLIEIGPNEKNIVGQDDTISAAKLIASKKHVEMGQPSDMSNAKVKIEMDNSPALG